MKYDVSLQTISWFRGRNAEGSLEISPKFQRRPVWLDEERSQLMSTILKKLPFPEVYIQSVLDTADGTERHIVVDGQQRITSILMFIENEVQLPQDDDWSGQYFRDLGETQKENFWNYKIVVRGLSETNDAEIRDLFARLNSNNIALNDQELRNAKFKGRFKQAAERIGDNPLFQEIGLFSPRDIRRMLDIEFASELLLLNVEGVVNKKDLLDDAYARFESDFPEEVRFESEFSAAITLLRSIINQDNAVAIKTRSNFYSLYGACLRYHRSTSRISFKKPDEVAAKISALLFAVRSGDLLGKPGFYTEYSDAVSRAASDKGRRARREDILAEIISAVEDVAVSPHP